LKAEIAAGGMYGGGASLAPQGLLIRNRRPRLWRRRFLQTLKEVPSGTSLKRGSATPPS